MPASHGPVWVAHEVHHLVDNRISGPRTLLTGRAVNVGIEGAEIHGAQANRVDLLDDRIRAREGRTLGSWSVSILNGD